jgi:hypothetical protein
METDSRLLLKSVECYMGYTRNLISYPTFSRSIATQNIMTHFEMKDKRRITGAYSSAVPGTEE